MHFMYCPIIFIMITETELLSQVKEIARVDKKDRVVFLSKLDSELSDKESEIVNRLRSEGWIIQYSMF